MKQRAQSSIAPGATTTWTPPRLRIFLSQVRKRPDGKWWWRATGELVDTFCADFNWQHSDDDPPLFVFPNRAGWIVFGPFDHREQAKASIVSFFARTRPAWTMEKRP
jgi:hypothetical protein